jgi:cyclomaltodextrinase
MMHKCVILLCIFFALACNKAKQDIRALRLPYICTPIQLNFDSTVVYISEYITDIKTIDSVVFNNKLQVIDALKGTIIITNKAKSNIDVLHVWCKNGKVEIPVFASEKQSYTLKYTTSETPKSVAVAGSMNGWNHKASTLKKVDNHFEISFVLNPGTYQYRIWQDDKEMLDPNNTNLMDNGMGGQNNFFTIGSNIAAPKIYCEKPNNNACVITALDSIVNALVFYDNLLLPHVFDHNQISFKIPQTDTLNHTIRVYAHNQQKRSNDILLPVKNGKVVSNAAEIERTDMHKAIMYFAMVDRFYDGNKNNNRPTDDKSILPIANNMGGDITGITTKIKSGYFKQLGINTIWLSPIVENAEGAWGLWNKGQTSKFSAYHGYWPVAMKNIDNRFGNADELNELISVAHQHGMNVLLDYVAHHVHQNHGLVKQKPQWFTPLYLTDGSLNTERWDEHRLTTWFDTFLPTWKFSDDDVVNALTDTAMFWVSNFDIDGFRHDATKHIEEKFWRTLTYKIRNYQTQNNHHNLFQIGETYGNPELIGSYISSGKLDAQFDFNLYDALINALANDATDFSNLSNVITESLYNYGSHNLMGNITGNQDRARFISYADGSVSFAEDAKLAGWTRKIENKTGGFEKLAMLHAFLLTMPGVPCIYYGDEIGLPGGNDPDNRRMMVFDSLNSSQNKLKQTVEALAALRNQNMALSFGDTYILKHDDGLVYVRSYCGNNVLIVLNKKPGKWQLQIPKHLLPTKSKTFSQSPITFNDDVMQVDATQPFFEIFY